MFTGFLTIDKGTIIFTLINMLILFLLLRHFLFDRVNKVLEDRQSEVQNTYDEADVAKDNAKKLEEEYSVKLLNAKQLAGGEVFDLTEDIPPNYDFFSEGPGYDALD